MYHTNINNDKRNELKKVMDDFTTFTWGEVNNSAGQTFFDRFGAFVVGGKDALKFYNGPNFSNNYVSTQFQTQNSTLQSVEFKPMTISFTMGVYWFTIEEYRELLLLLHPYEVSQLSFSFAPEWYYLAKLAGISDSTRYVIGKDPLTEEELNSNKPNRKYRYYTEIKLTFEVQGEPCLHHFDNYTLKDLSNNTWQLDKSQPTDLDTPFDLIFKLDKTSSSSENITLNIEIPNTNFGAKIHSVFSLSLKNLDAGSYNFIYDSASGLLFNGDKTKLLSSQTTTSSGKRVLESLMINTFKLPGILESGLAYSDFKDIKFQFSMTESSWTISTVKLVCHARTNTI